ncbi:hypothetical protein EV426DRAFT_576283 [Tirmania nivea]|nr:hypothetical protein EV426DRAFT_576283 [Tirmania nivea]
MPGSLVFAHGRGRSRPYLLARRDGSYLREGSAGEGSDSYLCIQITCMKDYRPGPTGLGWARDEMPRKLFRATSYVSFDGWYQLTLFETPKVSRTPPRARRLEIKARYCLETPRAHAYRYTRLVIMLVLCGPIRLPHPTHIFIFLLPGPYGIRQPHGQLLEMDQIAMAESVSFWGAPRWSHSVCNAIYQDIVKAMQRCGGHAVKLSCELERLAVKGEKPGAGPVVNVS